MANDSLRITVSPHLHKPGETISRGMRDVLIALTPIAIFAVIVYGISALLVILVSMLTAGLTEALMCLILRKKMTLKNLSAMVTGLLFAFLLPCTTPLWVVAIGAFLAIAVGKYLVSRWIWNWLDGEEGSAGLGMNILNPALLARVMLMFSPLQMYVSKFVRPFFWRSTVGFFTPVFTSVNNGTAAYKTLAGNVMPDVLSAATPLSLLKSGRMLTDVVSGPTPVGATWVTTAGRPSFWSTFLGFKSGSIGEVSVLLLLLGGIYLIWRGTINWRIPAGIIGATFFLMLAGWNHPIDQLLGGGLFLGAFYMATDWVTSPMSNKGAWVYALGIGLFVAVWRLNTGRPEGVALAILTFNIATLAIDRYVARTRFGDIKATHLNKLPSMPMPAAQPAKKGT
jgi:electron transport complex protein RnfD